MKKSIAFIYLLLSYATAINAQDNINLYGGEKIKKEKGLIGIKHGDTWIVPARYSKIEDFYYRYLICEKESLFDIYKGSERLLILENINSSQLQTFKSLLPSGIIPTFINNKWGFEIGKTKITPIYDSLFRIEEGERTSALPDNILGFSKDKKFGVVLNNGTTLVEPDDYMSFKYEYLTISSLIGSKDVLIGTLSNGKKRFFSVSNKKDLGYIEDIYIESKSKATELENFWNGIKIYKSDNNKLGAITGNGKTFVPPVADEISFQGVTAYCRNNQFFARKNFEYKLSDTLFVSSKKDFGGLYLSEETTYLTVKVQLSNKLIELKAHYGFDYRASITTYFNCEICKNGNNNSKDCKKCTFKGTVTYETISWLPEINNYKYEKHTGLKDSDGNLTALDKSYKKLVKASEEYVDTNNNLKFNQGKIDSIGRTTPYLIKPCNIEFYNKISNSIRKDDINSLKNDVQVLMKVSGFTQKNMSFRNLYNPKPNGEGENCINYHSLEKDKNKFNVDLEKFESGAVQFSMFLNKDEVQLTMKALKQNNEWKFLGIDRGNAYWENNGIILSLPSGTNDNYGGFYDEGTCLIYKSPKK
ncbi:MAG: hypothetical protein KF732_09145 [Flavobacteriales bacterium]|nr:hypothetical protein [Flavobacteriales bacterium]MBX2960108.1 hypothetical protein [Flavobacteriales bacterium]MCL4817483.1 hypothetical protein [Flavobacteriales bacterium]